MKNHILIIANNQSQRCMYADMLTAHGYRVSEAQSVDDAMFKLKNKDISLIVFDEYDQENNVEFLIKGLGTSKNRIDCLILTSNPSNKTKAFLKKNGYGSLLIKPIDMFDFVHAVSVRCSGRSIEDLVDSDSKQRQSGPCIS
ncbi:MAG: hypothetical protein LBI30_03360 [Holosporales bacterium]|jgi:DNA-binding NtrC family response regulator|nr:hypothetical protein [Holosporales bacterium]